MTTARTRNGIDHFHKKRRLIYISFLEKKSCFYFHGRKNQRILFHKGECLRTHRVRPLGFEWLSFALVYPPKVSSLKDSTVGSYWQSGYHYLDLSPKREFLRTFPRGPIVWRRFFLLEFQFSRPSRRIPKRPTYWMLFWLGGWVEGWLVGGRIYF